MCARCSDLMQKQTDDHSVNLQIFNEPPRVMTPKTSFFLKIIIFTKLKYFCLPEKQLFFGTKKQHKSRRYQAKHQKCSLFVRVPESAIQFLTLARFHRKLLLHHLHFDVATDFMTQSVQKSARV